MLDTTHGKYQSIWAYGLRNPFTFAFQSRTGDLQINDVGGVYEEINRGIAGKNYGWPVVEHGPTDDPRFEGPIHIYPQASISGGVFVPSESGWPIAFREQFLFADFVHGWIHAIDPESANTSSVSDAKEFAAGLRRPVDMRFGADGALHVLLRNAWVADGKLVGGTGSIVSIRYAQ